MIMRMAPWGHNDENHLCMNTITKGNSWRNHEGIPVDSCDKQSNSDGVRTESWGQAWPEGPIIKSSHRLWRWEELSSCTNPQSDIISEEHLKILLRILPIITKITALFHLHEYALYEFMQTNTFSVRTPEGGRNFRRSNPIIQWAGFSPHPPKGFIVGHNQWGWILGAEVHHCRCVALRRVVWRATLDGQGTVVSTYL